MNNLWVWGSLILGGLALEFFDVDQTTRNWIAIVVVGLFLTHIASEKEDKGRKIIEKIDERLDALELQQHKQRNANRRIAKLEDEIVSLEDDMIDVMKCESLKDDLFDALLKRDEKRHKDSSKSDSENQ